MKNQKPKPLGRQEVNTLYAACDHSQAGRHDKAMLVLLFNCGLSLTELADLRVSYIDYTNRWLWVIKGLERPRFVPLNGKTAQTLRDWLTYHPQKHFVLGDWGEGRPSMSRFLGKPRRNALKSRFDYLSEKSGIVINADIGRATLMRQMLELSEEGQNILSFVPEEKRDLVTLPLENLPPFSVMNQNSDMPIASKGFIPMPSEYGKPPAEDDIIKNGRSLLEKVGQVF